MKKTESFTPPELAAKYRCNVRKILTLIADGKLRAINLAQDELGERPRWRILPEDLLAFENRRASPAPAAPALVRRKPRSDHGVSHFFS